MQLALRVQVAGQVTVDVVMSIASLVQREPRICMSPVECRFALTPTEPPAITVDGS